MFKKLWKLFWYPSTHVGAGLLATGGILTGLIGWGVFTTVLDYTNTTEFCVSCHEMNDTVYEEYKKSAHYQNTSGVRAECADCHVPKALGPKLYAKLLASKDLYGHFTGVIDTKEKFEAHRLTMAESVWKKMEATNSRECLDCHNYSAMIIDNQASDAKIQHPTAIKDNDTCISCHKGLAHTLPDMSSGYKKRYEDLVKQSVAEGAKADVLYPIDEVILYGDKALTKNGGRVLPGTKLTVIGRSGNALNVRLNGWQQDGVKPAVYEFSGKRIFQAALTRELIGQISLSETITDPDTDIVWHKISLEGWMKKEALSQQLVNKEHIRSIMLVRDLI